MKKNIIFLHLESLNHTIFNNRQWFPFTNKIYSQSLRLNNFISTATSSMMAFSDLLHGDDNTLEHNTQLEENISIHRRCPSLFDALKKQGYTTAGMGYPVNWANVDTIWSEVDKFNWYDTSKNMLEEMQQIVSSAEPFALYLWNLSSHLCYYDDIKRGGANSLERWQRGYQSMDFMIGQIIKIIFQAKKFDNTIIVAFGDHGDDFWGHGFNGGYAHGIEPYTSLVHTPAFIYCPGMKPVDLNHMVSMVDIYNTVLTLVDSPTTPCDNNQFHALHPQRKVCFSRNLFSQQKSQHNGSPLKKGYAITNEYFHLMKVDNKYKMFLWKTDPANQLDILPLLKYNKSKAPYLDLDRVGRQRAGGAHPHIMHFFSPEMAQITSDNFNQLQEQLNLWIDSKNQCK